MLSVRIVAVGGIKEKFFDDAISEYVKRLQKYCKFEIAEVKECNSKDFETNIRQEVHGITERLKGYVVLCDVQGAVISSEQLAGKIKKICESNSTITFIIGGSNGVGDGLKSVVNENISFGTATFPHQLFRVMLTEQIYRAFTILNNEKYHK